MTLTSSFPKPSSAANGYSSGENSVAITHPAIRDFPAGERPRERLAAYGAGHLSNSEFIAILLRTGL